MPVGVLKRDLLKASCQQQSVCSKVIYPFLTPYRMVHGWSA